MAGEVKHTPKKSWKFMLSHEMKLCKPTPLVVGITAQDPTGRPVGCLVRTKFWRHTLLFSPLVQNMASEIFVHACHLLKRAETFLVASQIYTIE